MNATLKKPEVIEQTAPSLLDQIAADSAREQARIGSRYKPVMRTDEMIARDEAVDYLIKRVMKEGIDYGYVPGTKQSGQVKPGEYQQKPTLFKAGAETACAFFGYAPHYEEMVAIEEWTPAKYGEMLFYYKYSCVLSKDGAAVGEGLGSASTWESKYRYRTASRVCPSCGAGAIIKGKSEYGAGWLCFKNKGGCGAKYKDGDKAIEGQETGRIPNTDVADVINTVQKMGQKRAYVAATLTATGLSGRFTQDLDDTDAPKPPQTAAATTAPEPEPEVEFDIPESPKIAMLSSILNVSSMRTAFAGLRDSFIRLEPSTGAAKFSAILKKYTGSELVATLKFTKDTFDSIKLAAGEMFDWVQLAENLKQQDPPDAFDMHLERPE